MHAHGLHVLSERNGDNPFVVIAPGEVFDYEYRIPADHPAGTFWYHPHHHQYVADQIFGGLAGCADRGRRPRPGCRHGPGAADRRHHVDGAGRIAAVSAMDRMTGGQGSLILVNGQHQPVAIAESGDLRRLLRP
ncbi:MAG: multicopper oxidase domain-containing protein [Streptosporangiales bacterium]|nr:multicopper oxidase domain-containing protein [Streptosporangiales bacterium]